MAEQSNDSVAPSVAPTLQLSRRGLVLSLLAMVGAGLSVYAIFPDSVGGPPLPVVVSLDKQPVPTPDGGGAVMTEVVVIENPNEFPIKRVSIDLNDQYLLHRELPLQPKETLVLPQRVFVDKRNNSRFDPGSKQVEEIVVTGQLPSGARGVSAFPFE